MILLIGVDRYWTSIKYLFYIAHQASFYTYGEENLNLPFNDIFRGKF